MEAVNSIKHVILSLGVFQIYEGESNENLKYFLPRNLLNT